MVEGHEVRQRRALRVPEAAREFQARLDRFRAAVAEERARQPRELGQTRRQLRLQRMVEEVRRVQQRRRLLGDRARQHRMRVAERGHADTRNQVEIALTRVREQGRALAVVEDHRGATVDLQHVLGVESDRIV
jgi:hypothetical protein